MKIFWNRVTSPLCREFPGDQWIPPAERPATTQLSDRFENWHSARQKIQIQIWQLGNKLWVKDILRDLGLKYVSDGYPVLYQPLPILVILFQNFRADNFSKQLIRIEAELPCRQTNISGYLHGS